MLRAVGLLVDLQTRVWAKTSSTGTPPSRIAPGERLGVDAVGPGFVAPTAPGAALKAISVPSSGSTRPRPPASDEPAGAGSGARGVEDEDARAPGRRRQRAGEVGNLDRDDRNVGVARDPRIDGEEIVVAVELDAAAREIDEGLHVGPERGRLVEKIAQRAAQAVLVEVARADDVEARRLQRLGDEAGVVGGGREGMIGIGGIRRRRARSAGSGRRRPAPSTAPPRRSANETNAQTAPNGRSLTVTKPPPEIHIGDAAARVARH